MKLFSVNNFGNGWMDRLIEQMEKKSNQNGRMNSKGEMTDDRLALYNIAMSIMSSTACYATCAMHKCVFVKCVCVQQLF